MDTKLPNSVNTEPLVKLLKIKGGKNGAQKEKTDDILKKQSFDTAISTKNATINLRKALRYIGLSMPQQHRYAYILYSFAVNSLVSFGFPLGFALSYWRMSRFGWSQVNPGLLLNSLQVFINLFFLYSKLASLTLMRPRWGAADVVMERLDQRCRDSPQEIDELRLCVRQGNRCVVLFIVAFLAYSTSTFLGSFVMNLPPYNLYIPFLDWHRSHREFVLSALIEFMLVNVCCVQQGFNDSFAVVYIRILRTHINILLLRFAKLGDPSKSFAENLDALKQCIRDHKTYLELYGIVGPIISITLFIQFVGTVCILSATLVNILLIARDFSSRVGSFFYIIAVILEIVPVCYHAQCLMDDSSRLAEVIFHSNWIDQDVRYRKMLVFLMQRTQCTKTLTAGKLFPINLSCCLSVVKFSFTLYTFIKTMDLREKFGMQ